MSYVIKLVAMKSDNVCEWWSDIIQVIECYMFHDMSTVSVSCLTLLRYSKLQSYAERHVCVMMLCFTTIILQTKCAVAQIKWLRYNVYVNMRGLSKSSPVLSFYKSSNTNIYAKV